MSTYIFQAVWPIIEEPGERADLTDLVDNEARKDLLRLAAQAHARLIGPPVWIPAPADQVPGFTAYAPGRVLIARAPAVPAPTQRPLQAAA
jgi:hypothetical protein